MELGRENLIGCRIECTVKMTAERNVLEEKKRKTRLKEKRESFHDVNSRLCILPDKNRRRAFFHIKKHKTIFVFFYY